MKARSRRSAEQVALRRELDLLRRDAGRLREKNEELERFFSLSLDLLCIFGLDGRLVRMNKAWEAVLGYPVDELEGRNAARFVHPDEWAATQAAVGRLAGGEALVDFTNRCVHRDGSSRWIEWRAVPCGDGLVYAAARDVSERRHATQELQDAERRYRFFLENLHGIAYQVDTARDRPLFIHGTVEEITGFPAAELIEGRIAWTDLVHPDDRAEFAAETGLLYSRPGHVADCEYRVVRRDGGLRWVKDTAQVVGQASGSCVLSGLVLDVTARHRAEESLHAEETRVRSIFRAAPIGIGLVVNGVLVQVNDYLCEMSGYPMEELVGHGASRLHASAEEFEHYRREAIEQLRRDGMAVFETRWVRRGGSVIDVLMSCVALDPADLAAGITFTSMDITERKRAAEEVARMQAVLTAAIEQSPAGIIVADAPSGRTRLANSAAEALGMPAVERAADLPVGLRRQGVELLQPDGRPFPVEDLPLTRAIVRGETVRNVEAVVRRADGEQRWILANAAPVRDGEGRVIAGVVVAPDITDVKAAEEERRRLQAQVQHVQKLESLGVLAGGIAHDFNNMLMAILGNAELALRCLPPSSSARPHLREIETASRRSAELCRQMLAYSGKGRFVVEPLDLNEVVQEMTRMLEVSISKTARLRFDLARGLPAVEADATQLRQVVMNLITNASEAIGEQEGAISLRTGTMRCDHSWPSHTFMLAPACQGEFVYIEVEDTGCGMSDDVKARLFDPFFTTKFTGRGLGMAAVLGIVRGHRGAIRIDSEPGRGTSVCVAFPASEKAAGVEPPPGELDEEWHGRGTVLLVDDEETVRAVTADMLRQMGFEVLVAADGRQAVETFRARHDEIRCILLDLTMPVMDGEETTRQLRRIDDDVRVVMTSGYDEQDVNQRFARRPAAFVQKPFRLETLQAALRSALEGGAAGSSR